MNYTLNDGNVLPAIGFGTYKLNGANGVRAMVGAVNVGYRMLDAAFNYENEGAVGEAVRQSGIPRSQLTIASKLPGRHHRSSRSHRYHRRKSLSCWFGLLRSLFNSLAKS